MKNYSDNKFRKICAGLVLCMSLASLTGCSNHEENADSLIMGRVTSISGSKIVMEVFDKGKMQKPDGKAPGAVSGSARQPGKPDAGKPEGTPSSDAAKPEGTPPSDIKKLKGDTKTFELNDETKVYKQSGNEKVEIAIADVDPGSIVFVSTEDNVVTSVVIQEKQQELQGQS